MPASASTETRYAAMLAGGNAAIELHHLAACTERGQLTAEQIQQAMERAVYRALRQAFREQLNVVLPEQMPDVWSES